MTSSPTLRVTATDRVMVLAVHPDDESLATGGLLQRAVAAGASVRVIFVTDGENNPWPQRVLERRWRIGTAERARWGQRRRQEALAALARLGVAATGARFLAWPDQGLTRLLLGPAAGGAVEILARHLRDWRPSLLFAPSLADRHPDHNALAVLVRLALGQAASGASPCVPKVLDYLVHGNQAAATASGVALPLFVWEKYSKRAAIAEHASQLLLSRRRFLAYATDEERFVPAALAPGSRTAGRSLTLEWELESPPRPFERLRLHFVFASPRDDESRVTAWTLPVKETVGGTLIVRASDGVAIGTAEVRLGRQRLFVRLPVGLPPPARLGFVKLQRRRTFFDADGWREMSLPVVVPAPARARKLTPAGQPLQAGTFERETSWRDSPSP